jgi:hypothetical protein
MTIYCRQNSEKLIQLTEVHVARRTVLSTEGFCGKILFSLVLLAELVSCDSKSSSESSLASIITFY